MHHQSQTSLVSPKLQLPALGSSGVLQFTRALQGRQKGSLRYQLERWLEVQALCFLMLDVRTGLLCFSGAVTIK